MQHFTRFVLNNNKYINNLLLKIKYLSLYITLGTMVLQVVLAVNITHHLNRNKNNRSFKITHEQILLSLHRH